MTNHRETSLSKLVSLRAKRSPSSLKCFHVQLRRDLAEAKQAKAGNLFRLEKIASSSLRSAPPCPPISLLIGRRARNDTKYNKTGSILIMALWILGFLSLLAASLGVGIRQRITLLERLESRDKLQLIAESGIRKAIVLLNHDIKQSEGQFTTEVKVFRFNNEKEFGPIVLGDGTAEVSYEYHDGPGYLAVKKFGVVDEESKINVNKAAEIILRSLMKNVLGLDDTKAHDLAQAIVDWREYTEGEIEGFYSESYYENLADSYPVKKADFELIDELLLVEGFNSSILEDLKSYLTVYGDGGVNINTASRPVLMALGTEGELVDKILSVRRGGDGIEATADDYVFEKTSDMVSELRGFVDLSDAEANLIDRLNQEKKFDTNSRYYSIRAQGKLNNWDSFTDFSKNDVVVSTGSAKSNGMEPSKTITCVFNTKESKIEYWKEDE